MIYTVYVDNTLLYNPFLEEYYLVSSNLEMIDNEIGYFEFTIYDDHPAFESIVPLKSRIKIYRDGQLVWLGRPVNPEATDIEGQWSFYCEFCLCYLKDSLLRPFDFSGAPDELFEFLITSHNAQVNESQRFVIGDCTVEDPNNYIARSSTVYLKTFEALKSRLIAGLGGHIVITYDANEKPIISLLGALNIVSTQTIEFGKNLIDYERRLLYDSFYTAIVPLGAKDDSDVRLTIESVNDGNDYLIDSTLSAVYGVIYAPINETTWDDVTVAANLRTKGLNWLNTKGVIYKHLVSLSSEDISFMSADEGAFWFLQKVRFLLNNNDETMYLISDFGVDITNPSDLQIVLTDESTEYVDASFTTQNNKVQENTSNKVNVIESDYTNVSSVRAISEQTITNSSALQVRVNEIISEVLESYTTTDDMTTLLNEISSRITQMASSVDIRFTETNASIDGLNSSTAANFDKIESFIYLMAQTSTQNGGVVIGESTSEIKLKLENDILYFFTGSASTVTAENAIAYFASGKLYVNNAQIQSLTLGIIGQYMDVRIVGSGLNVCEFHSGRLS